MTAQLIAQTGTLLEALRKRKPRIHCLTNSVVQKFTADGLSALGAHPSMTQSPEEVADFAIGADALLVNLGTLDAERRRGIGLALDAFVPTGRPWALDPVHCDRSPGRLALARDLLRRGPAAARGNAAEMALLGDAPEDTVMIQTGPSDHLKFGAHRLAVLNGHPLMAQVTGTGCLAGALIAAFLTVAPDRLTAAAAALLTFGVSAELAAARAGGPGTFAALLLDALANVTPAEIREHGRIGHVPG